ncbi:MAG: hypothetical protein FWE95_07880, partial [Planctomycetaceae bacterium]|nr:hypothetical protein [Planctomycetaceae bacterium]
KHYEFDEQFEVNVRAAEKMANLHDDLERHGYAGADLEIYLVRLLFCLFSADTGIFPKDAFLSYVKNSKEDGSDLSGRMVRLFEVLNVPDEARTKRTLLSPELRAFRYINGRLFEDRLPSADFDAKMRETLLDCCRFDWSKISPAIFGAMFQGVMNRNLRRELGAHYTSEKNILKVIDPLFMDDLRLELAKVKVSPKRLDEFHERIAKLKFFDPACGCGNFLMVAYQQLRELEIEVVRIKKKRRGRDQKVLDISMELKVSVEQFYGIEIEEFPCEVARVSLWLMDHLMNRLASKELGQYYERLPLSKEGATIIHGNAHRIDWESVVPKGELSYILGNPPYSGARTMTATQKEDMLLAFGTVKNVGNLDYVTAWYKRATDMMTGTTIRVAFVSTNSIAQGEQVAILWKSLIERGISINFAYRAFKWANEAKGKAAVHCVIIGFSFVDAARKCIFDGETKNSVARINPYLVDAPDIFIERRETPICNVPPIGIGNKPIDNGNFLFTKKERKEFLRQEPQAKKWFRPWMGSDEFINGYKRYCLWLGDCPPSELRQMPEVMKRVEAVRKFRRDSKSAPTRKLAGMPCRFHVENMPKSKYIVIPETSSERREYIPIGFLTPNVLCSNAVRIMPNATLYHFGILTSSVHMAWMRYVGGRLEMRYRYSKDIVYNNFPWMDATDEQKAKIEELAQDVLNARVQFPNSSLADLYDPLTMPPVLLKAHQALDRAVIKLYQFKTDMSESAIVAALMKMYQKLTAPPTLIPEPPKPRKRRTKDTPRSTG